MSEEIQENLEPSLQPEQGLYGYTVDYNIYKLAANNFSAAIEIIKELGLTTDHYLIQKSQDMLLITKEEFSINQITVLEKLQ
jgi:hypothetical protein